MTAGRCIGRVGGLAVALGIGTALAGWGDCPAWADTTAGAAGATTSSQSAGTPSGAPEKKQRKPVKPKPKSNKHADTADRDKADKDKADKADKDKPDKKVQKPAAADKPAKGEVGKGAGDKGAVDKGKADKADEAAHRVSPPGVTAAVPAKTVSTSTATAVAVQVSAAQPTVKVAAVSTAPIAKLTRALRSLQAPVSPLSSTSVLVALAAVRDELERKMLKPTSALAPQPVSTLADTTPNVLVIGVDGTNLSRVLADPANANFFQLMQGGTTAPASIVGHTTISNPSWTAILTGVWGEKTGVINNIFNPAVYDKWPTVFNQLETFNPGIQTTAIANWDVISAIAVSGSVGADHVVNISHIAGDSDWSLTDDAVGDATEAAIAAADPNKPNFVFSYFVGVDENGHNYGGASQQYADAVRNVDENIGEIMQQVNDWEAATGEQWTVIVVTDHGHQAGKGLGHGFQSPNETSTFVIANNPNLFTAGGVNLKYQIVDVTPTVVTLFGGTPAPKSDGVSITNLGGSTVTPIDDDVALRAAVLEVIGKYGYPDIGTDLKLGVRTVFASVPYFLNQGFDAVTAQLESIAAQHIFVVSPLAEAMTVPVQLVGSLTYAATNAVAQVVARLTGVTGASLVPIFMPPLPPLVGTEDPAPVAACTVLVACGTSAGIIAA
ncbi:alkaline phosphatase family protein [Mycolicibacterium phocaicum]|uniref:alkaline phosphatase family protein n=1 Tax=Mycolicibacterium phocaicum TaxID=319706 RepID=UPI001CFC0D79|nr:alkaline phosphatase family protein [Mycolicibacterium phocaicum]UCZ62546.1 alkaline phosphatase family protein [Mycolicibacterium phocaicum]